MVANRLLRGRHTLEGPLPVVHRQVQAIVAVAALILAEVEYALAALLLESLIVPWLSLQTVCVGLGPVTVRSLPLLVEGPRVGLAVDSLGGAVPRSVGAVQFWRALRALVLRLEIEGWLVSSVHFG